MVGRSGSASRRFAVVDAERPQLAGLDLRQRRRRDVEHHLHLAGDQVGDRRRRAAIGHMGHVARRPWI